MPDPGDLIPAKIRELPGGTTMANAGMEIGQGDLAGAISRTIPVLLTEIRTRSYLKSRSITAPPGAPGEGDRYVVAAGGSGAWAAKDGQIAEWLLLPNNAGPSTGSWYFAAPLGIFFVEDEGILIVYAAAGVAAPSTRKRLRAVVGNAVILASDGVVTIDASGGPASVTVARALGSATITQVFTVERAVGDATGNIISIIDDLGAAVGAIYSQVAVGQVPWLDVRANGAAVTCKGVP